LASRPSASAGALVGDGGPGTGHSPIAATVSAKNCVT
jgi:hypothetical protein